MSKRFKIRVKKGDEYKAGWTRGYEVVEKEEREKAKNGGSIMFRGVTSLVIKPAEVKIEKKEAMLRNSGYEKGVKIKMIKEEYNKEKDETKMVFEVRGLEGIKKEERQIIIEAKRGREVLQKIEMKKEIEGGKREEIEFVIKGRMYEDYDSVEIKMSGSAVAGVLLYLGGVVLEWAINQELDAALQGLLKSINPQEKKPDLKIAAKGMPEGTTYLGMLYRPEIFVLMKQSNVARKNGFRIKVEYKIDVGGREINGSEWNSGDLSFKIQLFVGVGEEGEEGKSYEKKIKARFQYFEERDVELVTGRWMKDKFLGGELLMAKTYNTPFREDINYKKDFDELTKKYGDVRFVPKFELIRSYRYDRFGEINSEWSFRWEPALRRNDGWLRWENPSGPDNITMKHGDVKKVLIEFGYRQDEKTDFRVPSTGNSADNSKLEIKDLQIELDNTEHIDMTEGDVKPNEFIIMHKFKIDYGWEIFQFRSESPQLPSKNFALFVNVVHTGDPHTGEDHEHTLTIKAQQQKPKKRILLEGSQEVEIGNEKKTYEWIQVFPQVEKSITFTCTGHLYKPPEDEPQDKPKDKDKEASQNRPQDYKQPLTGVRKDTDKKEDDEQSQEVDDRTQQGSRDPMHP